MGFIITLLSLILLRRYEVIELTDFQLILLALISEAIFALYLIGTKFVNNKE